MVDIPIALKKYTYLALTNYSLMNSSSNFEILINYDDKQYINTFINALPRLITSKPIILL